MKYLILKYSWNVVKGYRKGEIISQVGIVVFCISSALLVLMAIALSHDLPAKEIDKGMVILPYILFSIGIGTGICVIGATVQYIFCKYCEFSHIGPPADCELIVAKKEFRLDKWWWGSETPPKGYEYEYTQKTRI